MRLYKDELATLPVFADASRSELAVIRRHLTMLPVSAGRLLMREGSPGDEFMIISEGLATVIKGDRTVATLERGDLVGEMALLDASGRTRRNATVIARTKGMVYVGTPNEFRQILDAVPSAARKIRQTAAERSLAA